MSGYLNNGTIITDTAPSVVTYGSAVGRMEGEGPLGSCFDYVSGTSDLGEHTWEKAESRLQQHALEQALIRGSISEGEIDFMFAGDLLNQCTASAYSMRDTGMSFFGLYGACSTFAEGLILAAAMVGGMGVQRCAVLTSSHFSSAERQFRFPLAYGGQRTPNAQWTCTAAGSALITQADVSILRNVSRIISRSR